MGTLKNTIKKILKESEWSKDYEPFWWKEGATRLGGSLDFLEHEKWENDENIKKWEKEGRLHATPLENFTYGIYVIDGDDEVIDYVLNKFK